MTAAVPARTVVVCEGVSVAEDVDAAEWDSAWFRSILKGVLKTEDCLEEVVLSAAAFIGPIEIAEAMVATLNIVRNGRVVRLANLRSDHP